MRLATFLRIVVTTKQISLSIRFHFYTKLCREPVKVRKNHKEAEITRTKIRKANASSIRSNISSKKALPALQSKSILHKMIVPFLPPMSPTISTLSSNDP